MRGLGTAWSTSARAPKRGRSRGGKGHRDAAVVPVIEAVLIAIIVAGAVLFTTSFQAPPAPSSTHGVQELETTLWDAARSLDKMYYDDPAYANSALSKALADALEGESANLTATLDPFMPPGALYNVYLNNGYDRIKVYESRTPTGQTVGISYPFEPRWRQLYAEPDLEFYNENDGLNTMGTTLIPIYNTNLVTDQGHLVQAKLTGNQSWIPGQQVLSGDPSVRFNETAHTTLLQGATDDTSSSNDYPSVALHMMCRRDSGDPAPCYATDITDGPIPDYSPVEDGVLRIAANVTGTKQLAEGATITIELPSGMPLVGTPTDPTGRGDWGSSITVTGTPPHPQTVEATLARTLDTASPGHPSYSGYDMAILDLELDTSNLDPRYAFKNVLTRLEGGAVSEGQFLVKVNDKTRHTYTGGDARVLMISTPKPAGAGTPGSPPTNPEGRWGFVMPVPFAENTIERVNISLPDGQGVITDVRFPGDFDPVQGTGDLTKVRLDHTPVNASWTWRHDTVGQPVQAYDFFELQLVIETNGKETQASAKFPQAAPETLFQAFRPPPNHLQLQEGVWWGEHPPQSSGVGMPGFPRVDGIITGELTYRNTVLRGTGNFSQADLGDVVPGGVVPIDLTIAQVKDALQAAELGLADRHVALGTNAVITLDARDLASFLSQTVGVNNMDLETKIYAPWGVRERIPVATYNHVASAGVSIVPTDLEIGFLNSDSAADVLVASSDGNVYGISGKTSRSLPGLTFPIPGSDELTGESAKPLVFTKVRDAAGNTYYGIGTDKIADFIHGAEFDGSANQVWQTKKDELNSKALAVNSSMDLGGLGAFNDLFVSLDASEPATTNPAGLSRFKLYDGQTGAEFDGWQANIPGQETYDDSKPTNYGVTINGSATQIGMGKLGASAVGGLWSNTGLKAGVTAEKATVELQPEELEDPDADEIDPLDPNLPAQFDLGSITVTTPKDPGLIAFRSDGRELWNLTGGRIVRAQNAEKIPTGGDWTGMVAGGGDGWVYGLNGKKGITPAWGFEYPVWPKFLDVTGANALEGYLATGDGMMMHTRDGWTSYNFYVDPVKDWVAFPGVRAVDTPGGPYWGSKSAVSWWAGEGGQIKLSTDRLTTVDHLTGLDALAASTVTVDENGADVSFPDLDTLSLTDIRWNDVYAVSAQEAWFAGEGVGGILSNEGLIGVTQDGGGTVLVSRIGCEDGGLSLGCGLNAIDYDGERFWVTGDNGTVLTQEVDGQATEISFVQSPKVTEDSTGYVTVDLKADSEVTVRTIQVDWKPSSNVEYWKALAIERGSGDELLWDKDDADAALYVESGNYLSTHGVDRGAVINVKARAESVSYDDSLDDWNGDVTLKLGPFKKTLTPTTGYYGEDGKPDMPTPTDFQVTVTYDDGTQDIYLLGIGEDARTPREASLGTWKRPQDTDPPFILGNGVQCFGNAEASCADYHGINITTPKGAAAKLGFLVGELQMPDPLNGIPYQSNLMRFDGVTRTWSNVDKPPVQSTLRDVAINVWDPKRAVAVGENNRITATYNAGLDWTDLPKNNPLEEGIVAPFWAVDFHNADVAIVTGGNDANALLFTVDGHTEYGRFQTTDFHDQSTDLIRWLGVDTRTFFLSQDGKTARVVIDVWDNGQWQPLFDPDDSNGDGIKWIMDVDPASTPSRTYIKELDEPTDEIKFRVTMRTPSHGFSRFSPQIYGQLGLRGYTGQAAPGWDDAHVGLTTWDMNVTSQFVSGTDSVNITGDPHGVVRLKPVHNPWVFKLGNPNSDWGTMVNRDTKGARVADLDVSPDGNTIYVGTEGIYEIGKLPDVDKVGSDDTVYALDPLTGNIKPGWNLARLPVDGPYEPITHVLAMDDGVVVVTHKEGAGEPPKLWKLDTEGDKVAGPRSLGDNSVVLDIESAAIWSSTPIDVVVAVQNDISGGTVRAFDGSNALKSMWEVNPSVKGAFEFEHPVDMGAAYGAYIIESLFRWDVPGATDDGQQVTQTARIHNAFTVTPPNKKVALSPTYTLEIVAWLEDWG